MAKFGNVSEVDLFFVSFTSSPQDRSGSLQRVAVDSPSESRRSKLSRALLNLACSLQANTRSQSQSRIYYIGFMGETRQLKKEPGDRLTGSSLATSHHAQT